MIFINFRSQTVTIYKHRFIYETFNFYLNECLNWQISEGLVIDHINNNKLDNRLINLQMVSQSQNCNKSYGRNYGLKRSCRFICHENLKILDFISMTKAGRHLGINNDSVRKVCLGITKSSKSKTTGLCYYFHYLN